MTEFAEARKAMVDCQVRPSDVTNYGIIEAMLEVPREVFIPRSSREVAYAEAELPMEGGRRMLAPRTFAKMLEAAQIGPDDLVLDVAPGTGYSTAVLSHLSGAVVAAEPTEELRAKLQENVAQLELDNVVTSAAGIGDSANGPYDVILVNVGVQEIPATLSDQLKDGGRLVAIFMDGANGQCRVVVRTDGQMSDRYVFDATADVLVDFQKEKAFAL